MSSPACRRTVAGPFSSAVARSRPRRWNFARKGCRARASSLWSSESGLGSGIGGSGGNTAAFNCMTGPPVDPMSLLAWAKSRRRSELQGPQACVHDTGAECAGRAGDHSLGEGGAVLRTEILPGPDDWRRCPVESFDESPVVSRSVIGTFGQSSRNRNWCNGDRTDVLPELTLVLHLPLHLPLNNAKSICAGHQLYDTPGRSASDCGRIYSFLASSCPAMRGCARGLAPTSAGDLGPQPGAVPPARRPRQAGRRAPG